MKQTNKPSEKVRRRKATSPEAQEDVMISLAMNLAEEQLRNGTASSQVITHFLKLGTEKERLEREILNEQKKLIAAKTEAIESAKEMETLYAEAIEAMKSYRYTGGDEEFNE